MRPKHTRKSPGGLSSPVMSVAAIALISALTFDARALSCAQQTFTLNEAYAAAHSIIIGMVTECLEPVSSDPWAGGGADCSFDTLEVLKASKPARDYRGVASSAACGLSLQVGNQYLLFLDDQNRPLQYSAGLGGEHYTSRMASNHVRILREFRDGVVSDLSDPWISMEHEGNCMLSHTVGGLRISFSQRKAGAPPLPVDWTRETIDGKTVIRSKPGSAGADPRAPDWQVVLPGDVPEFSPDAQMLGVSFQDVRPAPERQATLTVGSRSWTLFRQETSITLGGTQVESLAEYRAAGETSEEILTAMMKPSNIVITASLVSPSTNDPEPEPTLSAQEPVTVYNLDEIVPAPATLGSNRTASSTSQGTGRAPRRQLPTEAPEPVLRIETRSTQLPAAAAEFKACVGETER